MLICLLKASRELPWNWSRVSLLKQPEHGSTEKVTIDLGVSWGVYVQRPSMFLYWTLFLYMSRPKWPSSDGQVVVEDSAAL
jgi:hypothetical protein